MKCLCELYAYWSVLKTHVGTMHALRFNPVKKKNRHHPNFMVSVNTLLKPIAKWVGRVPLRQKNFITYHPYNVVLKAKHLSGSAFALL